MEFYDFKKCKATKLHLCDSISIDFDDLSESGVFVTTGMGAGANVGFGVGSGFTTGDIEGITGGLDVNLPPIDGVPLSGTIFMDPASGAFGGLLTTGPGIGISTDISQTIPILTVGGVVEFVDELIPDPVPSYRQHRYPIGTGNCIKGPPQKNCPKVNQEMDFLNEIPNRSFFESLETEQQPPISEGDLKTISKIIITVFDDPDNSNDGAS